MCAHCPVYGVQQTEPRDFMVGKHLTAKLHPSLVIDFLKKYLCLVKQGTSKPLSCPLDFLTLVHNTYRFLSDKVASAGTHCSNRV